METSVSHKTNFCCLFCQMKVLGVDQKSAAQIWENLDHLPNPIPGEMLQNAVIDGCKHVDDGKLILTIIKENHRSEDWKLMHTGYYQMQNLACGGKDLNMKMSELGFKRGMVLEIIYNHEMAVRERVSDYVRHMKTWNLFGKPSESKSQSIGALLAEMLFRSQRTIAKGSTYKGLEGTPKHSAVLISSVDDDIPFSFLALDEFVVLPVDYSKSTGYISCNEFQDVESRLSRLKNVKLVIVDKIRAVDETGSDEREIFPNLQIWMDMLKRGLGDVSNIFLVMLMDTKDFDCPGHQAAAEIAERNLQAPISFMRLEMKGAEQKDFDVSIFNKVPFNDKLDKPMGKL